MKTFAGAVGMFALVAALIVGWSLYYTGHRDSLPAPVRVVLDLLDSGGPGGPVIRPVVTRAAGPLEACPDFAADATDVVGAAQDIGSDVQDRFADANQVLLAETQRVGAGGAPLPIETTGVASALSDQIASMRAMAIRLQGVSLRTAQARSLTSGVVAATWAMSDASAALLGTGSGRRTLAQWTAWTDAGSGPQNQALAGLKAFEKCP